MLAAASESRVEPSYDRVKVASLLAAHIRAPILHSMSMYTYMFMWQSNSCLEGRSRDTYQVGTQFAFLDGSGSVENAFKTRKIAKVVFANYRW